MSENSSADGFDVETLADKTIDSLSVQPGQVIWIWASTYSLDLIEALAYRIRARGAFWTLRLTMESLLQRIGLDLPEPYLTLVPEHELRWLEDVDAIVEVRDHSGYLPERRGLPCPSRGLGGGSGVIAKAFFRGKPFEGLRLTFSRGRVVRAQAPDPGAVGAFWELLWASLGDKDRIAEFAIGLNPGVAEPVGDVALDEKIGGSVHIAIGMNHHFGGQNRSNLHLDLVIMHPTVWLDSYQVVADGVLQAAGPAA